MPAHEAEVDGTQMRIDMDHRIDCHLVAHHYCRHSNRMVYDVAWVAMLAGVSVDCLSSIS